MGRTALCLPLALLFLASVISSNAQKTEVAGQGEESRVTVTAGAPLTVECRLRPEQRAEWRRDGEAPPTDLRASPEAPAPDARLAARLRAPHARAAHAGLYTCTRERDHRVRVVVMPAPLAPLAGADAPVTEAAEIAAGTPAPALGAPGAAGVDGALLYDVRGDIVINCTIPNEPKLQYIWHKNGTDVGSIGTLKERYMLERDGASFHIKQSVEDDYGNYSCALAGQPETNQTWAVRGRPYLKLPANSNVVEGQNLKIVCKVIGKPYPTVQWLYTNSTESNVTYYDVSAVLGSRVKLAESEQGVPDGVLVLDSAARTDAGSYSCNASDATQAASTMLRVKDMYAALWPFLGICAEVVVLCAIILVYEKRRTKPDLDDSDTDNHDQKKS